MKKNINAMLMMDFYKSIHQDLVPEGMTKSMSYFTPRMSRVKRWDKVVMFGLQMFIKTWLIDYFNENFFDLPEEDVITEYERVLDNTLGKGVYTSFRVRNLHKLGYLPIEIVALPEGTLVPMHTAMFGITNTHPDFAYLPQALESLISAEMWYPMICATVGHTYREIVNKYYDLTCEDVAPRKRALGNFDFRGDMGLDASLKAASGWCLSFVNSATVPVIPFLEDMYNCDCAKEEVAFGAVSTEHFIMCSNFAVDGDEKVLLHKLLTQYYPHTSFSCVLDSYDYWHIINDILIELKDDILNHDGCMLMRGDSGDCVEVVTKTVFKLWELFGGTINSKGYKVLDPHVKTLYGDSITVESCERIYQILMKNGFACSNVSLGIGSFSMHCIEEDGQLKPFTRDTFSSCIKACYCEVNGKEIPVFKDPKDGKFKKSQRGLVHVHYDENKELTYEDGYTTSTIPEDNLLKPIFRDGILLQEDTLNDIRQRLNKGTF